MHFAHFFWLQPPIHLPPFLSLPLQTLAAFFILRCWTRCFLLFMRNAIESTYLRFRFGPGLRLQPLLFFFLPHLHFFAFLLAKFFSPQIFYFLFFLFAVVTLNFFIPYLPGLPIGPVTRFTTVFLLLAFRLAANLFLALTVFTVILTLHQLLINHRLYKVLP